MVTIITDFNWGVVLILLPLAGGVSCFLWPRASKALGLITTFFVALSVVGLGWQIVDGGIYRHAVGGWEAPLGIILYADGLSLLMLVIASVVGLAVSIYSAEYFKHEASIHFWSIWLFLLAALNALFLSADIFNLYVTLELMGLAAVTLAALPGNKEALSGAMRYLLATLLGSLVYLLGVALLYHAYGSVDISTLAERVTSSPISWAALGLMGAGLALKTALFPLHFWLPPAHSSAPAPVSAILSSIVVKASFYILLRLWLTIFAPLNGNADVLFGVLGAGAVLWGSLQALRQSRLKLLVAYSTVAQLGYLFIGFPLATISGIAAWSAVAYLALSHAFAKAAMFLVAGNLIRFGGHDRISDLDRVAQRLPITAGAFALAGVSIMGLPPSGGFIGKWLLLEAALSQGRWGIATVLIVGGILAASYIFKVLGYFFTQAPIPHDPQPVPPSMEWTALVLAIGAILLGFLAPLVLPLIGIGDAFGVSKVNI